MAADIHPEARKGFSSAASTYERGRPDYPAAIRDWLGDALGLGPGRTVLDLGAGTGKFTTCLRDVGAEVVAVEPVAEMRAELSRKLPDICGLDGTAEAIPLADAACDAVVCAQAFHWFAGAPALAEIARVLKPGGALGLVWNMRDDSVDWVAELGTIMAPHERDTPRARSGAWAELFPSEAFGPLQATRFAHAQTGAPDRVILDRVLSVSFIAALPGAERAEVEARLRALVATHPALAGRAQIAVPYVTHAFRALRR